MQSIFAILKLQKLSGNFSAAPTSKTKRVGLREIFKVARIQIDENNFLVFKYLVDKVSKDPIVCYREYYRKGKTHLMRYTGRHSPHWL